MESQHMNQQSFANFIGVSPASLSSILQERTRPTLNTVEAICGKMPKVNIAWLLNGSGEMFIDQNPAEKPDGGHEGTLSEPGPDARPQSSGQHREAGMFEFKYDADEKQSAASAPSQQRGGYRNQVQSNAPQYNNTKNIDKQPRRITEIRVFYDDQTWESFVPKK